MHECITNQTRISYARMLIEVNITKPLPSEISILEPAGREFKRSVDYDSKPAFCEKCMIVGHKYPAKMIAQQ